MDSQGLFWKIRALFRFSKKGRGGLPLPPSPHPSCAPEMESTIEHDMLFCSEVIAFDLYQYKPGSKELAQCLARIAESFNSTEEP